MTKQEIKEALEKVERQNFFHEMKDHWEWKDYEISRKYHEEIRKLEKMFEEA